MNDDPLFVAAFGPNELRYFQDFRGFTGVPVGVRFAVYPAETQYHERYKLIGPGYGQKGDYGDGAIFVYATKAELIDAAIQWCNVPMLMDVLTSPAAEPKVVPPGGRLCVRCGLPADRDWDDTPHGPEHDHQSTCITALKVEVSRLRAEVQFDRTLAAQDGAEVVRLRAECQRQAKYIRIAQEHMPPAVRAYLARQNEVTP